MRIKRDDMEQDKVLQTGDLEKHEAQAPVTSSVETSVETTAEGQAAVEDKPGEETADTSAAPANEPAATAEEPKANEGEAADEVKPETADAAEETTAETATDEAEEPGNADTATPEAEATGTEHGADEEAKPEEAPAAEEATATDTGAATDENATAGEADEARKEEEEEETKEVPAWDFKSFTTEEIIARMKELVTDFPVQQLKVLDTLPPIFDARWQREHDEALAAFTADGSPAEDFEFQSDAKERFYNIYKLYKEKRSEYYKRMEEEKEENLRKKLEIIEELKALVEKEEAPNRTYQEFKALQERWRATGPVPPARVNDLLESYHLHVENFFNYIKLNRELRDLDLKKNLDAKTALCEQAERLLELNDVGTAFRQLQLLHQEWKEVGPVAADQKEAIWERFKAATSQINDNYHRFIDQLKAEQEGNLRAKEALCGRMEAILARTLSRHKEWNAAVTEVQAIQEEWKQAGLVPMKERNKILKRFRALCDTFFERRRAFTKELDRTYAENLRAKTALCEQAEALKDSTDWKATAQKLMELQKEWKATGPVARKHADKVWKRFRAACDYFFEQKKENLHDRYSEQTRNLEAKRALLEELRNFTPRETTEETVEALQDFQTRWTEIGFVPRKAKEALQSEFRTLMNGLYDQLDMGDFEKNIEAFKAKIGAFEASDNRESKLIEEREKLAGRMKQVENDLHVWENNIGFFSKSGKTNEVVKEFEKKIEGARHKLALMQEKLRIIDGML